jgi:hypothetical protein
MLHGSSSLSRPAPVAALGVPSGIELPYAPRGGLVASSVVPAIGVVRDERPRALGEGAGMDVRSSARRAMRTLGVLFLIGGSLVGLASSASAVTCQTWTSTTPNRGPGSNVLLDVSIVSPCRAWAVGSYNAGTVSRTLVEEWNGSRWILQSSPNVGTGAVNRLQGVSALSTNDAWAVGVRFVSQTTPRTLIEHWTGSAWSVVPSPNPSAGGDELKGVDAISATNAWAVGSIATQSGHDTLVEHWNGTTWKVVPSPNPPSSDASSLNQVDAVSPTNVWAVGSFNVASGRKTLVEHWNGTSWKIQPSPNPSATSNELLGVSAVSPTNAWAVGDTGATPASTLIVHWNGQHWTVVQSVDVGTEPNELGAVVATSAKNAWAVGFYEQGHVNRTLVEHWNGTAWKRQASPNIGTGPNALAGVDAGSATNAWAVGIRAKGSTLRTLAVHCC